MYMYFKMTSARKYAQWMMIIMNCGVNLVAE